MSSRARVPTSIVTSICSLAAAWHRRSRSWIEFSQILVALDSLIRRCRPGQQKVGGCAVAMTGFRQVDGAGQRDWSRCLLIALLGTQDGCEAGKLTRCGVGCCKCDNQGVFPPATDIGQSRFPGKRNCAEGLYFYPITLPYPRHCPCRGMPECAR